MPDDLEQMPLTGQPSDPPPDGHVGAVALDTVEMVTDNLKAFTDSIHHKASQVVSWLTQCEQMTSDRAATLLGVIFVGSVPMHSW